MKISSWSNIKFDLDSKILWPCPSCNSSSLKINKEKFHSEDTAESKNFRDHEYWDFDWITLIFSGVLECSSCNEIIIMTGYGTVEHQHYYDRSSGKAEERLYEEFQPNFFNPPLHIFRIPENCPELINNEIIDSFKLFWLDLPSCANKLRTSLELLLNNENVPDTISTKRGNSKRLTLHDRIVEYQKTNKDLAEFILAIKWIGNAGSHIGELTIQDLIDAYELLDFLLVKLYDNKENELKKISKEINQSKGARRA